MDGSAAYYNSTPQPPHALPQLLVARVRIDDGSERTHVPGEPLGEEEVVGRPIDVGHRRVAKRVAIAERVPPREAPTLLTPTVLLRRLRAFIQLTSQTFFRRRS